MADIDANLPDRDAADGTTGSAVPALSSQVAGSDGTNLRTLRTDSSGNLFISGRVVLSPSSPTTATVGVTSSQIVAFNASRRGLIVINVSIHTISIGIGVVGVLNSGITLYPGGVWNMDDYSYTTGSINAIASVAGSVVSIQEFN